MLWFFLGFGVGILAGAFFLVQSLTIILFGFSHVVKMRNAGALAIEARTNRKHAISLVILLGLFVVSYYGVSKLNFSVEYGFWVGVALMLVFGFSGTLNTRNNRAEFLEKNIHSINPEFITQYVINLYETEKDQKWIETHLARLEQKCGYPLRIRTVSAYVFDPFNNEPVTESWIIGSDISEDLFEKFYNKKDDMVYVLRFYDNGDSKDMVTTKEFFFEKLKEINNTVFDNLK